ncbi:hypothetical protein LTR86_010741 [Recurvomyces mirabilis]|nr:hypothetical protein LTR86_010741 [Recurvomyces mirabilis]
MPLSCFRPRTADLAYDSTEACRPKPRPRPTNDRPKSSSKFHLHRHSSADSRSSKSSSISNDSISRLPPCSRLSDPSVDAMMMPLPPDPRPSRCLRLSNPKTYGDIVSSMKCEKGCRDWRNFAVFHDDDVDMTKSADDIAKKVAAAYERKFDDVIAGMAHVGVMCAGCCPHGEPRKWGGQAKEKDLQPHYTPYKFTSLGVIERFDVLNYDYDSSFNTHSEHITIH